MPACPLFPARLRNSPVAAGKARVRIAHTAPFSNTIAGTVVDICTSLNGTPVLDDVPYKASAVLELDTGLLDTFIGAAEPDCSAVALDLPALALQDGQILRIYAIGDGDQQPVSLTYTASPGLVLAATNYLPLVVKEE